MSPPSSGSKGVLATGSWLLLTLSLDWGPLFQFLMYRDLPKVKCVTERPGPS